MAENVSSTEQEPSIEEILASIRQIISDDDDAPPAAKPAATQDEDLDSDDDVVELINRVDNTPPAAEPEPEEEIIQVDMKEPDSEPEEKVSFDSFMEAADESEPEPEPEPVFSPPPPPPPRLQPQPRPEPSFAVDVDDDSLLTERAETAALNAFTKLAAKTAIDRISGVTIEDIVRDEIRPMLREWLDRNLPDMVERLVREELDRVARRAVGE